MTAKKISILVLALLSVAAVVLGLCLFFMSNRVIRTVPNAVFIDKINQNFFLTTDFCEGNQYCFKLEQKVGANEFLVIDVVKSDKNHINLNEQNIDLNIGAQFRFSACYATESDLGNGDFCQPILWTPNMNLKDVNYDKVVVNLAENKISWDAVSGATSYILNFVDKDGNDLHFKTTKNEFDLIDQYDRHKLGAGEFKLYIIADNDNINCLPSNAGNGLENLIEIDIKNEIVSVAHDSGNFLVSCTQKAKDFAVIVDEELRFEVQAPHEASFDGTFYVYDLYEALQIIRNLDYSKHNVKIFALQNGHSLESDIFVVR